MIRTIEVTQKHINTGIRNHCYACPIALAFSDAGFSKVIVTNTSVSIYEDFCFKDLIKLPKKASYFIKQFDSFGLVKPFSFDIYINET